MLPNSSPPTINMTNSFQRCHGLSVFSVTRVCARHSVVTFFMNFSWCAREYVEGAISIRLLGVNVFVDVCNFLSVGHVFVSLCVCVCVCLGQFVSQCVRTSS